MAQTQLEVPLDFTEFFPPPTEPTPSPPKACKRKRTTTPKNDIYVEICKDNAKVRVRYDSIETFGAFSHLDLSILIDAQQLVTKLQVPINSCTQ